MAMLSGPVTYEIRHDLREAMDAIWFRLARPGATWTGAQRVAIAAETRNAFNCDYCKRIAEALSPFSEDGEHDSQSDLLQGAIDLIHRLANDSSRLTPSWFTSTIGSGLSEPAYVEAVAVAVSTIAVDSVHYALGMSFPELPDLQSGEPTGKISTRTQQRICWVPTVPPKEADGELKKAWWPDGTETYVPRIHQTLTLVPSEAIAFRKLSEAFYLPAANIIDFSADARSLTRAQTELIASRTAALNECFY